MTQSEICGAAGLRSSEITMAMDIRRAYVSQGGATSVSVRWQLAVKHGHIIAIVREDCRKTSYFI